MTKTERNLRQENAKLRDALTVAIARLRRDIIQFDRTGYISSAHNVTDALETVHCMIPDPTPVEPEATGEDVPEPDWDRMRSWDGWPWKAVRAGLLWLKAHLDALEQRLKDNAISSRMSIALLSRHRSRLGSLERSRGTGAEQYESILDRLDALEKQKVIIASPDVTMPDEVYCSTAQPDLAGDSSDAGLLHAAEKVRGGEPIPGQLCWFKGSDDERWAGTAETEMDYGLESPVLPSEIKIIHRNGETYRLPWDGRVVVEEKSDEKS